MFVVRGIRFPSSQEQTGFIPGSRRLIPFRWFAVRRSLRWTPWQTNRLPGNSPSPERDGRPESRSLNLTYQTNHHEKTNRQYQTCYYYLNGALRRHLRRSRPGAPRGSRPGARQSAPAATSGRTASDNSIAGVSPDWRFR